MVHVSPVMAPRADRKCPYFSLLFYKKVLRARLARAGGFFLYKSQELYDLSRPYFNSEVEGETELSQFDVKNGKSLGFNQRSGLQLVASVHRRL